MTTEACALQSPCSVTKEACPLHEPDRFIPTAYEFTDIAGLVKGASQGEGLGNKFLSHIREVDAIVESMTKEVK